MNKNASVDTWITETGRTVFSNGDVVRELGMTSAQATRAIQAHQIAQNAKKTKMRNLIHRRGRARNAVWHVGSGAGHWASARSQHAEDIAVRTHNGVEKFGVALVLHNPKLRRPVSVTLQHIDEVLAGL